MMCTKYVNAVFPSDDQRVDWEKGPVVEVLAQLRALEQAKRVHNVHDDSSHTVYAMCLAVADRQKKIACIDLESSTEGHALPEDAALSSFVWLSKMSARSGHPSFYDALLAECEQDAITQVTCWFDRVCRSDLE